MRPSRRCEAIPTNSRRRVGGFYPAGDRRTGVPQLHSAWVQNCVTAVSTATVWPHPSAGFGWRTISEKSAGSVHTHVIGEGPVRPYKPRRHAEKSRNSWTNGPDRNNHRPEPHPPIPERRS
jgi:hypothetical protein